MADESGLELNEIADMVDTNISDVTVSGSNKKITPRIMSKDEVVKTLEKSIEREKQTKNEPSMEDILSAIRRILDDNEDHYDPMTAAWEASMGGGCDDEEQNNDSVKTMNDEEPSMEDILDSIRRILSEDEDATNEPDDIPCSNDDTQDAMVAAWDACVGTRDDDEDDEVVDNNLASEWAAMLDCGADGDNTLMVVPRESTRVLNQAEIDSLLGFDENPARKKRLTAEERKWKKKMNAVGSVPYINDYLDDFVSGLSNSLSKITNTEIYVDSMSTIKPGDLLNSVPLPAMFAEIKLNDVNTGFMIIADSSFIYSTVDVLLGGRRGTAAMRIEGRPYTKIEHKMVGRYIQQIIDEMKNHFSRHIDFIISNIITNPAKTKSLDMNEVCTVIRFRIDMEDRGGSLNFVMNHSDLQAMMKFYR